MGSDAFERTRAAGRAMTLTEAADFARGARSPPTADSRLG